MKPFREALRDGFRYVKELPRSLSQYYHSEGINEVDLEGIHAFVFGDHKEYELRVEPFGEDEDEYLISLYKHNVLLTERLRVWIKKKRKKET